jgi:hypothetical protein
MPDLKLADKLTARRNEVMTMVNVPEDAIQTDTATFYIPTSDGGYGKLIASGCKDDADPVTLREEWLADKTVKAENKAKRDAEKAKKVADAAAKKAKK